MIGATRLRLARAVARIRVASTGDAGPRRFHVSTVGGQAEFRKTPGVRRYKAAGVIRRYQPAATAPASATPANPVLKAVRMTAAGIRWIGRGTVVAGRITLRLLLDESATSSRSQRAMTEASMKHDMPMHLLPGFGPRDLN